jgi:dipeptidyl aminopeptidase/acylaminoacyl peptidase
MRRCTLLVLALLCGPPCLADTQAAAPLPYRGVMLEDQLAPDARELAFPRRLEHSLSPDGRRVAYVAKKLAPTYSRRAPTSFYSKAGVPDPYQGAAVRVLDLRTGRQREPLPGDHNTWNARWSPDGRYLAFLSDKHGQVNLFVWDSVADSLAEFRQRAVHAEMFPENSPPLEWAADSRHIVFQASTATPPPPADPADWSVEVFNRKAIEDANPFAWTGKGRVDLCVVDLVRVQVRTVVSGANLLSFRVAPRGNKIALLGNLRQASKVLQNLMDLYIIEIPGEAAAPPLAWEAMQPQVKDVKEWTGQSLAWSPDGWKLAFLTSGAQASGDIFVWDARSARLTNVSEQVPAVHAGTKALDYSPKFSIWYYLSWLPDSSAVLGLTRRPEGSALWKVPVAGGAPAKLFQGAPRSWVLLMTSATSVSSQVRLVGERQLAVQESVSRQWKTVNLDTGKVTATVLEDMPAQLLDTAADAPAAVRLGEQDADLWVYRQGAQAVRVSDFAGRLASQPLGTAQSVAGFGLDGEALTGLLLLPSAASKSHPVPLIAYVYAGQLAPRPEALKDRGGESWFRNHLLARGYAVLYVSIPNHFRGQWSGAMLAPVLSQVDAAVRTGAVDPARVGVHGHSFGGYTVNMLITHTRRFKAAVSVAGIADPVASALGGAGPDTVHLRAAMTPGAQPGLGATPWDNASRYVQNSPVHHLEEVVTPLLLIHGDADISVPIDQSQALYHGLVSLEKEVEFVRYLGGNHYLNASPDMIRDFWRRVAEWYDRHLQ